MGIYFSGPVDPGNPLIASGGAPSSSGTKRKSSSGTKSSDKEPKAYYGQTGAYELLQADKNNLVMQRTSKLESMLKNDFQGDKSAFLNSREVMGIIKEIQNLNAMEKASFNAIENEKVVGDKWYSNIQNEKSEQDYAYDGNGRRFYINDKGQISVLDTNNTKSFYKNNGRFITNEELYNYQRRNLGITDGVPDQGYWTNSVDHKANIFTKEMDKYIQEVKAGYSKGGGDSELMATGALSYLASTSTRVQSNEDNLQRGVSSMKDKLSNEALEDAKMQYWKEGWDQAVLLHVPGKKKGTFSPLIMNREAYESILAKNPIDENERAIHNAKEINSEEAKFDEFILAKAQAMANGNEQNSVINSVNYHKRTEAGADAMMEKSTFYGAVANTEYVVKAGTAEPGPVVANVMVNGPDDSDRILFHKEGIIGSYNFTADRSVFAPSFAQDEAYLSDKLDSDGEPKYDALQSVTEVGLGKQGVIGRNNVSAMPSGMLNDVKFVRRTGNFVTLPKMKTEASGDNSFVMNEDGGMHAEMTWQEIEVELDADGWEKWGKYVTTENKNPVGTKYENDENYTYGAEYGDINNNSKFWDWGSNDYDIEEGAAKSLGLKESTVHGNPYNDEVSVFKIFVPVYPSALMNSSTRSASTHDLRVMNSQINGEKKNKDNAQERIKAANPQFKNSYNGR